MIDLGTCLATRDGSPPESDRRDRTYYRALIDLTDDVFVEACDRLLYSDDWFPSIARIRAVADECRQDRARTRQAIDAQHAVPDLVCPTCAGARWVNYGGYDPLKMHAGESGSRVQRCPSCCDQDGVFLVGMERAAIRNYGGKRNPNGGPVRVDMNAVTWPQQMDALRDPLTGRIDMDKLYRLSREMRGLDPDVDERPAAVSGWRALGRSPEPARTDD